MCKSFHKVKLVLVNIRFRLDISMPVIVTNPGIGFGAWQRGAARAKLFYQTSLKLRLKFDLFINKQIWPIINPSLSYLWTAWFTYIHNFKHIYMNGMLGFGPKKVGNIMGILRNLENKLGQSVCFSFFFM